MIITNCDSTNLTFALSSPFHELHEWSWQIYEKLIMNVQIEQDFQYLVGRTVGTEFVLV